MSADRVRTRKAKAAAPAPDVVTAGLVLWGVLTVFALVVHPAPFEEGACRQPAEATARAGWTTRVRCGAAHLEAAALRGPARLLFGLPIDLNAAQARTLEVLPNIGPARAAAIVRARRQDRFVAPEDLLRIRGIGPRTLDSLRDQVSVVGTRGVLP